MIPSIHLAFENLIENAAEHGSAGNQPATDDAEHDRREIETPTVDIDLSKTDDTVTVTITDNGPGIPSHELAVLTNRAETDLEHGSGLGLWIAN